AVYSMHLEYEYYTPFLYRGYGGSPPSLPSGRWGWGPMPSPVLDEDDLKRVNVESRRQPVFGSTLFKYVTLFFLFAIIFIA
ncbi:Endonuclease/exonuclease/phosphatase family protein, partial [human gut metagenome]